jgi:glycosyltransferase involved in cell wall biosynthesis
MATLTIGILTMNEERRIAACIDSAAFADQIIVVDSGSSDATVEIATAKGVEVYSYPDWQGFAVQRNRILQHATGDWIFFLDADEVVTPALAQEMRAIVDANVECVWEVAWEQIAYGQSLGRMRSSGGIPRLFPRAQILQFEGVVHEGAKLKDPALPVRLLKQRLPHYSRETIYGSLQKLAQYVQLGACRPANAGACCVVWGQRSPTSFACISSTEDFCAGVRGFCTVSLSPWSAFSDMLRSRLIEIFWSKPKNVAK